ncbi:nucleotidyltransferase domain-containing protein [Halorutilales archaeon Cl-col2-1]
MKRGVKEEHDKSGISISLPVPSLDSDLFKHKATNNVLLFLSHHRQDEFTISEIASQTGHTQPSVKRSVDVLEKNDLVIDNPQGNRRLIRINRERLSVPDDPYLQIPQIQFQKPVKEAVEQLKKGLKDVEAVVLYGSVARGEADSRSDIDLWILVTEDRAKNQRKANKIKLDLEEKRFDGDRYSYDIDVESISAIPRYTEDLRQIVVSGIPVYQTEKFKTVEKILMEDLEGEDD